MCREEGLRGDGFSQKSVMALEYPDNYFDVVYCLSVLEFISDPEFIFIYISLLQSAYLRFRHPTEFLSAFHSFEHFCYILIVGVL